MRTRTKNSGRERELKQQREIETQAQKVANMYRQQVLSAKSLVQRIKDMPEWEWARGDANLGALESCMKSLNEILHKSPFLEEFVSMDSKEMRKAYGAEFSEKVKVGTMKLNGPTECLVKACQRLKKMHKASLEK